MGYRRYLFNIKIIDKFKYEGQERYKMFSKLYLRGATGCIIVSDITRKETLQSALNWKDLANKCFAEESEDEIPIILFQNKVDLMQFDEKIGSEENNEILKDFDKDSNFIGSVETSAKENSNIKEGILRLVEEIIKRREKKSNKNDENDMWGIDMKKLSFIVSPLNSKKNGKPFPIEQKDDGSCMKSC